MDTNTRTFLYRRLYRIPVRPGREENQRYWVQEKRAKYATSLLTDISPCFSRAVRESFGGRCSSFLPFIRVIVAVIVSSLLRQRLGNNFAAQEEGKSQF